MLDFTNAAVADRRFEAVTRTLLLVAPAPPSPLWPVLGLARRLLASAWERGYRAEAGDFPRAPVFEAAAISRYYVDAAGAVADGRGWATERDVTRLRVAYERAFGLGAGGEEGEVGCVVLRRELHAADVGAGEHLQRRAGNEFCQALAVAWGHEDVLLAADHERLRLQVLEPLRNVEAEIAWAWRMKPWSCCAYGFMSEFWIARS